MSRAFRGWMDWITTRANFPDAWTLTDSMRLGAAGAGDFAAAGAEADPAFFTGFGAARTGTTSAVAAKTAKNFRIALIVSPPRGTEMSPGYLCFFCSAIA